jgi:hypothetical protein
MAAPATAEPREPRIVAGFLEEGLRPGLGLWTRHASPDARIDLPSRVHAVTLDPLGSRCVAVARRPGRFGLVVDLARFERTVTFEATSGRHFFGHGSFVDDVRLFLTTENDIEAGRGLIGLRDARQGFRAVAEWPSGGVGPHDLALSADGRSILIANGGIDFSPTTGRARLNEGTIVSAIAIIDVATGRQTSEATLAEEHASLSIRHLVVLAGGSVAFGCEETLRDGAHRPLVGILGTDLRPRFLDAPAQGWASLMGTIGEVAADEAGKVVAATAPRAGLCALWQAATGRCLGTVSLADCCGLGPLGRGFAVSSGHGAVLGIGDGAGRRLLTSRLGFDNHLAVA